MSGADPAAALVMEMRKNTAELARSREAVEKLTSLLEGLQKSVNDVIVSLNFQRASALPASKPAPPTSSGVEVKVDWRPFKDKPGHWIFSKNNPLLRDTLLAASNKTLEHGGFRYKLSGDNDLFINRFPLGGGNR